MMPPSNLVYSAAETPPKLVCLISGLQHAAILAPNLILPILVMRAGGGGSLEGVTQIVSLSLIAMGIGTVLQSLTYRWLGSGYLITFAFSSAYFPASTAAVKLGGMPLVFGMTLMAGAIEVLLAPLIRRMRPFFPAEISGICVLLIGVVVGLLAIREIFGISESGRSSASSGSEIALGVGTFALMAGLNVWSKGSLRMYCAIIGIVVGAAVAVGMGAENGAAIAAALPAGIVALPKWPGYLPQFQLDLIIPFAITALACCIRAMGDITNAQRINDRDWVRPHMTSIRNGVLADGLSTMFSALLGSVGGNTYSASVGLSNATGVTSRRIALWTGVIFIALSFFPIAAGAVVSVPRPVVGAALLFNCCFILVSGIQIVTSRLLDARKTFIVGVALVLSVSRDVFPVFYRGLPHIFQSFVESGFVLGVFAALLLNAIFRIGARSTVAVTLGGGAEADRAISFLEQQGARWGARRDVMARATFATAQAIESITEHCNVQGPITFAASFDEFNLDIRMSYRGELLALEDRRPTEDEIRDAADGIRRLAGYLLQRNADRVRSSSNEGKCVLAFHFQH